MTDPADLDSPPIPYRTKHSQSLVPKILGPGTEVDDVKGTASVETMFRREASSLLVYLQRQVRNDADAADLLSDVFVVAWRRSLDMPSEPRQARMWLFGVARRTAATHYRATIRRSRLVDRLRKEMSVPAEHAAADGRAVVNEDPRVDRLRTAMLKLHARDREILALVHWDSFTLTEAANVLGIRPGTARTRYQRARERVARLLDAV